MLVAIKQEMYENIKNSYFKLLTNNITLSIFKEFFLEKIILAKLKHLFSCFNKLSFALSKNISFMTPQVSILFL